MWPVNFNYHLCILFVRKTHTKQLPIEDILNSINTTCHTQQTQAY